MFGSSGAWVDADTANLTVPFTPPAGSWVALVSANGDMFTSTAGYNQDIGVALTGGAYPTAPGQPEAWKESGGFAGTYSRTPFRAGSCSREVARPTQPGCGSRTRRTGSIHIGAGPRRAYSPN